MRGRVGRPPRTTGGGSTSEGQLAVRFSRKERAELDQYAKQARTSAGEIVRIALRNMGVISWTEPSAA